jgi:hypothetical protein
VRCLVFVLYLFFTNISFAAEVKKLKFFNIDLHIAVIGDIKNIFASLGHEVESYSISNHAWLIDNPKSSVKLINQENWREISPEMVEQFYQEYKNYLIQFDGFIVTHAASFALLYEKFNKPIIIVNSTRYQNEFIFDYKKWKWLNNYLKKGVANNKIYIISNNKGDQNYLKYYTGLDSEVIPSLCLYTKAKYSGKKQGFIVKDRLNLSFKNIFKKPELIKILAGNYKWQELYDFQGIIHFPYQISTMSLFEQYSANIPLFFPTKNFLLSLHKEYPKRILSELSFYQVKKKLFFPKGNNNPDNIKNHEVLKYWVDNADFYDSKNMPYIQYFNSFKDLEYLLETVDLDLISQKMENYNKQRKEKVLQKWQSILKKIEENVRVS